MSHEKLAELTREETALREELRGHEKRIRERLSEIATEKFSLERSSRRHPRREAVAIQLGRQLDLALAKAQREENEMLAAQIAAMRTPLQNIWAGILGEDPSAEAQLDALLNSFNQLDAPQLAGV